MSYNGGMKKTAAKRRRVRVGPVLLLSLVAIFALVTPAQATRTIPKLAENLRSQQSIKLSRHAVDLLGVSGIVSAPSFHLFREADFHFPGK